MYDITIVDLGYAALIVLVLFAWIVGISYLWVWLEEDTSE